MNAARPASSADRRDHVPPPDTLIGEPGPERQREHHARHQQRLHHGQSTDPQRRRLGHERQTVGGDAGQPDRVACHPQQQTGPGPDRRRIGARLLLQHAPQREQCGRDERQSYLHNRSLSGYSSPNVCQRSTTAVTATLGVSRSVYGSPV